ncbi:MAG: DEAD/DEAH box helicase, partial [Fuerstia sp.]|nr:DEAD/DEAH box helicase [Fuerstiella sp.]
EGEGILLRGKFTPPSATQPDAVSVDESCLAYDAENRSPVVPDPDAKVRTTEWCHRRLLSRIHRLTMDGLRRQIEPVPVDVFMRFLFRHHGIVETHRREGSNGLFEVIGQLQGLDIPSVAWERDILPLRVTGYRAELLDELCLTGEVGWARFFPPPRNPDKSRPMASLTRVAPVSIFLREDLPWLASRAPALEVEGLSSPAAQLLEILTSGGAMFGTDLQAETRMLRDHLDDALGELVSRGLITADGFSGLRGLVAEKPTTSRRSNRGRAERIRIVRPAVGRWSVTRQPTTSDDTADAKNSTHDGNTDWAWQLLRRWGIVFRDLLSNEDGAPAWFELLQVFRKLEARGEIRGGRFITGVAGEQFALADTVQKLRQLRDEGPQEELVLITAADPLNLVGVLSKHDRVPRVASNRVAWLDGIPIAVVRGGNPEILNTAPEELLTTALKRLCQFSLLPTETTPVLTATAEPTDYCC